MAMKLYSFDYTFIKEIDEYDFPDDFSGIVVNFYRDKYWYLDGKLHRLDGPAFKCYDGTNVWYVKGNLHRLDGPAIEWASGEKEWWIDNKRIFCNTNEEFKLLIDILNLKGLI